VVDFTIAAATIQLPSTAEPFHNWDFPDGSAWSQFYRTSSGYLIRFPDLADFEVSVDGQHVTAAPVPGVSEATLEHLYLNQVLPLALSKHGKLVFHGSAVELLGGAVAFLAESGRGKSTLAASFAVGGHRFLTDDGLILEQNNGNYVVLPSHPSLRLWEDSEQRLLGGEARTAPTVNYTSKARFLAGSRLAYCGQPKPLLTAYFLGEGGADDISLARLTQTETLIEWAKHSFLLDVDDQSLIGAHFDRIAVLANGVPCFRLDYPRRYDDLSRVIDAVCKQTAEMGMTS